MSENRNLSMPTTYDPKTTEGKWSRRWIEGGYFRAGRRPDAKPYTIVIPPPNVTGVLHIGHALDFSLQDILIRAKRMQGYDARCDRCRAVESACARDCSRSGRRAQSEVFS